MALIEVRITRSGVANMGRRDLQAVGREAIGEAAKYWQKHYLPIHFTTRARNRYRYRPRDGEPGSGTKFKGSYAWRKVTRGKIGGVRAVGENKPLVWSGQSRSLALGGSRVVAKATNFRSYHATVVIPVRALNFVRGARDELTRTTAEEEAKLAAVFEQQYERALNRRGRTLKRTKRIAA